MSHQISPQHPAVVLRSHYRQLRALLAGALIAVVGLSVVVVILATDRDQVSTTSAAKPPIGSINYGDAKYVNPSTGYPTVPLDRLARPQSGIDGIRYDGGPEEGTAALTQRSAPAAFDHNSIKQAPGIRYDGGPEEGSQGIGH